MTILIPDDEIVQNEILFHFLSLSILYTQNAAINFVIYMFYDSYLIFCFNTVAN